MARPCKQDCNLATWLMRDGYTHDAYAHEINVARRALVCKKYFMQGYKFYARNILCKDVSFTQEMFYARI